eukprot:6827016-Alexandrium_andersonii.AAC.1
MCAPHGRNTDRSEDLPIRRRSSTRRSRGSSHATSAHAQMCSTPKPAAAVSALAGQARLPRGDHKGRTA